MITIDEKIRNSQRWREAQRNLDKFEEMMELLKQYPLNPIIKQLPPSKPYTIPKMY
jgi:hypothetical protein